MVRLVVFVSIIFGSFSIPTSAKAAVPTRITAGSGGNLASSVGINAIRADTLPPPMPASFFGEIHLSPAPSPGAAIQARLPGVTGAIASTVVVLNGTVLTYSVDVPGDISDTPEKEGGAEGDAVIFSIGGVDVATASWHSGTHTWLDFTSWNLPPPLPASFFGEIHLSPAPSPGAAIQARIPGVTGAIASTVVVLNGTVLTYSLDVPGDMPGTSDIEGGVEGDVVTISVGGIDAAAAPWHSGTHTRLDLIYPKGPPPLPAIFYGEIHFYPTQPAPGTAVEARIIGISGAAAATVVAQSDTNLVYSLVIPGDYPDTLAKEGGAEGDLITFSVGGRDVATGTWHGGTYTRLDFNYLAIILQPGWNLASINLHPANPLIAQVLSSIAGSYDQVYVWNAELSTNNWRFYSPSAPPYVNTLAALDEKTGFWIQVTSLVPVTLYVTGSNPTPTTINLSTTAGGWNLVGFPAATGKDLPGAIPAQVSQVYACHAGEAVPWKIFDRGAPIFVNTLTSLTPGWGYWVYTTASIPWMVTYP